MVRPSAPLLMDDLGFETLISDTGFVRADPGRRAPTVVVSLSVVSETPGRVRARQGFSASQVTAAAQGRGDGGAAGSEDR